VQCSALQKLPDSGTRCAKRKVAAPKQRIRRCVIVQRCKPNACAVGRRCLKKTRYAAVEHVHVLCSVRHTGASSCPRSRTAARPPVFHVRGRSGNCALGFRFLTMASVQVVEREAERVRAQLRRGAADVSVLYIMCVSPSLFSEYQFRPRARLCNRCVSSFCRRTFHRAGTGATSHLL